MRVKLGLAVLFASVVSMLALAAPSQAQTDPPTTESPSPTEPATTTTTTIPVVDGPIRIEGDGVSQPDPPERGSQVQVLAPPPRPTTTTTTTTTLPPPPDFSLPANSGTGRRAVYSKSLQKVWIVGSNGALLKEHRVSGKLKWCDPKPGEYRVFSRSRYTFSIQNPSIIWGYMVRFTKGCDGGNIGFHEIPTNKNTGRKVQSISQLGTPLSGGCVRQKQSDAVWIWNWAYVGTKVVVLP